MYPPELYPGPMIPSYALPAVGWLWPSDDYENYSDDDYEDGYDVTIRVTRVLLLLRDHLFVKH